MSLGSFQPTQSGYDYWLNYSPKFNQQFGLDVSAGNLTNSPHVNQMLQLGNTIESYGIVPTAAIISGGDPRALNAFNRTSFSNNPGDLRSTQLSPIGQAFYGTSNLPIFQPRTFEPTGYTTLGDVPTAPFNFEPLTSNGIPTGLQSQWFI